LDHANKANADSMKSLKRYTEQVREIQLQVRDSHQRNIFEDVEKQNSDNIFRMISSRSHLKIEEEQRQRDEMKEQYYAAEKRATILESEKEELAASCDQAERARKQAELDASDGREQANDLIAQVNSLNATKRRMEGELQAIHADLDETLNEYRASEESSKKAMAEAERLAEEVRKEQEHVTQVERLRVSIEAQIKELQVRNSHFIYYSKKRTQPNRSHTHEISL
uniref:Myosin_tail_1 domain-containing protein n=1 Tax=Anisakis simplex TaxID=6269 RepID=A0A0M3JAI2_ANISI